MNMNANGNDPGVTAKAAKPLASELIWEASGVGAELGLPTRVAYNLLRKGALPGQKVGGKWCSSRSALRHCFKQIISESAA
jgi:hypothetical protein